MKKEIKNIQISDIKNPNDIKKYSYKELDGLAKNIRDEIINKVSINGGHLSSNLGVVEATIALLRVFNFDYDKLLFDVGHQSYTYKLLTGRSLDNLRHKDGVSGFQKRSESKYDCFEAGHSSTSISAAYGMAIGRDLKKENYEIISFIGDASIANGLAFEGLNNLSFNQHKMIIVLNDNDMSISKPIGGLSNLFRKISNSASYMNAKRRYKKFLSTTTFGKKIYAFSSLIKNRIAKILIPSTIFDNLSLKYIGPCDGHNIKKLEKVFLKAKKFKQPVVVHIKTNKGRGYKYSEIDNNGSWHGVEPFDIKTGKSLNISNKETFSKIYGDALYDLMKNNHELVLINPATMKGSCLEKIYKGFPDRTFDVGISEEHAIVMAQGLALSGFHPIVSMYSTFLQRAYDEINHDITRMNINMTLLVDRAGMPGFDGDTHQGSFDESFLYDLPNSVISMATSKQSCYELLNESLNNHGLFVIRYAKDYVNQFEKYPTSKFMGWNKLINKQNKKCLISFSNAGYQVYKLILENNIKCDYYEALYQKPICIDYVNQLLNYEEIFIYDAYANKSGFCLHLENLLLENNFKGKIKIFAIEDKYYSHMSINEQLKLACISPEDILNNLK